MSVREILSRYNLIINRVRRSPATLTEIQDYLKRESELQEYNFNVSGRTFNRDLEEIWSLYKIQIVYDFSKKVYQLNTEDQPELNNRMLEAFDTINTLNVADGSSRYIHFENRKPQGTENFHGLLHAIKNNYVISFTYCKFWTDAVSIRKVLPYALKEFKGRWYVVAQDENDGRIKTFGLDRISNLEITKKKFSYPRDFDVTLLYKNSFGIINPTGGVAEKIILSFDPEQGKYIKSFPLHQSQKTIVDNEDELRISLELQVTYDLVMEILSHGSRVLVIDPENLRKEVFVNYEKSISLYK